MGILIITPFFSPNIGGVESYLNDLCEYLSKRDYKVYVITYQPLTNKLKGKDYEKKENLEIHRIRWFGYNWFHKLEPYPILEFLYLTPYLFIHVFYFLIKNHKKIGTLHAQGLTAAFIAKFMAKIFKKRSIISTCAVYNFRKDSFFAKVVKWLLFDFDRILPLGEVSKRELILIGLPENKMNIYYLWVDQQIYKPRDKAQMKEMMHFSEKFIILFIGRFIKIKGVQVLVDIAKSIDKKINLILIGDHGPLLRDIEEIARKYENIILVKNICGRDLIPYYQMSDILIVPSQYEEAFGKVITESLSCGTPVIAANRGALPYILDSSVGRLIEPDFNNIKREIEYLYHHPSDLKHLTSNCRLYAEKHFSDKNAAIIEKSYARAS